MKIMYIIALLSFAALAWAAFAITQHVRKNAAAKVPPPTDEAMVQALDVRLNDLSRSTVRPAYRPPEPIPGSTTAPSPVVEDRETGSLNKPKASSPTSIAVDHL